MAEPTTATTAPPPPPRTLQLQTEGIPLVPPSGETVWSSWYVESKDDLKEFNSYAPEAVTTTAEDGSITITSGVMSKTGSQRTLSARQISGQFEEEVAKSFEEDWEDEDTDDTFDAIMGSISRHAASVAASGK